jgi:hypothetical protein
MNFSQKPNRLSETGFAVGDFVTYTNDDDRMGGTIFRITEDHEPVIPAMTEKVIEVPVYPGSKDTTKLTLQGAWTKSGAKISVGKLHGFVRIEPVFEFFTVPTGKKSKKVTVHYGLMKDVLKPVNITILGQKFVELQSFIQREAKSLMKL